MYVILTSNGPLSNVNNSGGHHRIRILGIQTKTCQTEGVFPGPDVTQLVVDVVVSISKILLCSLQKGARAKEMEHDKGMSLTRSGKFEIRRTT